jgi:hypothetical protein
MGIKDLFNKILDMEIPGKTAKGKHIALIFWSMGTGEAPGPRLSGRPTGQGYQASPLPTE